MKPNLIDEFHDGREPLSTPTAVLLRRERSRAAPRQGGATLLFQINVAPRPRPQLSPLVVAEAFHVQTHSDPIKWVGARREGCCSWSRASKTAPPAEGHIARDPGGAAAIADIEAEHGQAARQLERLARFVLCGWDHSRADGAPPRAPVQPR